MISDHDLLTSMQVGKEIYELVTSLRKQDVAEAKGDDEDSLGLSDHETQRVADWRPTISLDNCEENVPRKHAIGVVLRSPGRAGKIVITLYS